MRQIWRTFRDRESAGVALSDEQLREFGERGCLVVPQCRR